MTTCLIELMNNLIGYPKEKSLLTREDIVKVTQHKCKISFKNIWEVFHFGLKYSIVCAKSNVCEKEILPCFLYLIQIFVLEVCQIKYIKIIRIHIGIIIGIQKPRGKVIKDLKPILALAHISIFPPACLNLAQVGNLILKLQRGSCHVKA